MTKCHLAVLVLTAVLLSACGGKNSPSLSEYGINDGSYRKMMFEKYVLELFAATPEQAAAKQDSTLRSVASDSTAFRKMLDLQNHFLNDVNSPYRCEDFYIPVLKAIMCSPFATESEKFAAAHDVGRYGLNRLGTPAADFSFTLKGGRTRTLYSVQAEHTILFFSNPGCENCKEIMDALKAVEGIDELLANGSLAIVNIYPDEDLDAWYGYVAEYPKNWISGYAPEIDEPDGLYNLRAIPTLYLLDRDKHVILKDAPFERLIGFLFY